MIARTLIAAPLLMAGALLTPVAAAASADATTPRALSLTAKDVQHQYGATFRSFILHTYRASKYTKCGANYTAGYLSTFGNFAKGARAGGVVSVEDTVFAYADAKSTACASAMHGAFACQPLMSTRGTTVHTSRLTGVGDSAYLFATKSPAGAGKHAYSVIIWLSRGTHLAMVTVSALGSAPSPNGAVALARIVDGRIQRSH